MIVIYSEEEEGEDEGVLLITSILVTYLLYI
jgi:hypothetical protein